MTLSQKNKGRIIFVVVGAFIVFAISFSYRQISQRHRAGATIERAERSSLDAPDTRR